MSAGDNLVGADVRNGPAKDAPLLRFGEADPGRNLTLEQARAWQRRLADGGWGAPAWPLEYGGRGLGPVEQMIWQQIERELLTSV